MFNLPEGVKVEKVAITLTQGQDDANLSDPVDYQTLLIETEDGGGGSYIVVKTDRWAMDIEDLGKYAELFNTMIKLTEEK